MLDYYKSNTPIYGVIAKLVPSIYCYQFNIIILIFQSGHQEYGIK